jgi:hypothetical protein
MNQMDSILRERRAILNSAATSIQALVRRQLAVKKGAALIASKQQTLAAAILIQASLRRRFAKMHYMLKFAAVSKIQTCYRVSAQKMKEASAATSIQTLVRRHFEVKCAAAILIQAAARGHFAKMNYTLQSVAASKIQSCYRANARKMIEVRIIRNNAATKIQSVVRGNVVRKILEYETYFVTLIQSVFRRWQATSTLNTLRNVIVKLQSRMRGRIVRCDTAYLHGCAVVIQAAFRNSRSKHHDWYSAIVIQSQWRRYSCQADFAMALIDIVTIQSIVRRWLAMKKLKVLNITDVSNDLLYNSLELTPGEKKSLKEARTLSLEGVSVQLFESSFEVEVNELKEAIAKAEEVTLQFW